MNKPSQLLPGYPCPQSHVYGVCSLLVSLQLPPFWQGCDKHLLGVSHEFPVQVSFATKTKQQTFLQLFQQTFCNY